MEVFVFVIFFVGIVALFCIFAYLNYLAEKRRSEELSALAAELGWRFHADRDRDHDDEYAYFRIFRRGDNRYAFNTFYGSLTIDGRDYEAKMGDFHYEVTSGSGEDESTTTYLISYLITQLPFPEVPELLIRPEGFFDKLKGLIGFDDIDFESAEFSRQFFVKSSDKRFAYDVIDPRMMEFLLKSNPLVIDLKKSRGLFTDDRNRWSPHEFRQTLEWTRQCFDRWPDHLQDSLEKTSS